MDRLDEYIYKDKKQLRLGYTTGSCSAAATKAAAIMLLGGNEVKRVSILPPKGIPLALSVLHITKGKNWVSCAVKKDSGDDPDVTHGVEVFACVERLDRPEFMVDGGIGVGRVTKPGLECAVGQAAINKVPRSMILTELRQAAEAWDYPGGLKSTISIPAGVELAKRTFNPRLGIEGGISVLGTSGIVEPMSEQALIDSIQLEMKQRRALGQDYILITPGNYGEDFARKFTNLDTSQSVKCSNYLGQTIDYAVALGFKGMLLIGHIGKMAKVAAGVMQTHSKYADARMEVFAAHAGLAGAGQAVLRQLMTAVTTDEAIAILEKAGIKETVLSSITERIDFHLKQRTYNKMKVGAMVFSQQYGLLGKTPDADKLMKALENGGNE